MNEFNLDEVRASYAVLEELCYLNTGTVGIMSEPVLQRHIEHISTYERYGHAGEAVARSHYEHSRDAVARIIGAEASEIALTRNASDGVNLVLAGLDLAPGTRIVSTTEEHPAVLLPLTVASRRFDARIDLLPLTGSDDEILSNFEAIASDSTTRLAIFSHVSCETGRRLPVIEMTRISQEFDVLTLVDGAQSVGQVPVDVREIGCDFMTGNGHKWLCGPKGTGFLYVRASSMDLVTPRFLGDGAVEPSFDRPKHDPNDQPPAWKFRPDAQRFEFGTRNWHLFASLSDALAEHRRFDEQGARAHVADLSTSLKNELADRDGVTVHTPRDWNSSCGLVTFSVDGWDGVELSQRLWQESGIIQRRVQVPNGVRISCAHFTSRGDLETFLDALDRLTQPLTQKTSAR